MTTSLQVSTAFDSGNIRLVEADGDRLTLEIARDHASDFYQWFHFRVTGAAGRTVECVIANAAGSAYPDGWPDYHVCWSADRANWARVADTAYADGRLTWRVAATGDQLWFAYFAPYSMEQHHDLVARIAARPGVALEVLGRTLDGQDIDCLRIGDGPVRAWLYARQHPGETMAEWWIEGVLDALTDPHDPVARLLRGKATFHVVPNMNPDGSRRGHLRTNAAGTNLNREWHAPSATKSPEVLCVRAKMDETGVDFAIDAHGDEAIPNVFLAGFDGIPSWREEQGALYTAYGEALARRSPDFQTRRGYGKAGPGKANLSMSTNQLAERYGAVAMTLEMPFKDNADLPDPVHGWSPERSMMLGRDCLGALAEIIGRFPVGR